MSLLIVVGICIALIGLAVAGIAIKMFLKKGGEFKKQCSVKDPKTGESLGCSCGGQGKTCHNS
ncbi:MAG TPA: hypothetical protein PLA88_03565 [Bacteroidales bacterium]|nr:hypothetical protein [Bacteroidales bacterium]